MQLDKAIATLPNVKRIFVPDFGYTMFDADLSGADAQVVAWEADDGDLKALFRSGISVHEHNAEMMFGKEWIDAPGHPKQLGTKKGRMYYDLKRAVHLTNYVGSARTLAIVLGWSVKQAEEFQFRWFSLHPGIKRWHEVVQDELRSSHTVKNACGYHRTYFDRPDSVLSEAIAWIPQSTIAICCFRGIRQLEASYGPYVEVLLQTHDSVTWQMRSRAAPEKEVLAKALENPIPYRDPLKIKWKVTSSTKSWGDCE